MRFYLYECRHGDERILVPATKDGWDYLILRMEKCNNMSLDEYIDQYGEYNVEGSFEEGWLYLEDSGSIEEISLTEV